MPRISVIVPVYKVEKYIEKCLDSISKQTFSDFECILVNDGSPDRSGEICRKYAEADSRFRVIDQENAGVSAARNRAIAEARGEFIAFIDSDDHVEPDFLSVLIGGMKDSHICGLSLKGGTPDLGGEYDKKSIEQFFSMIFDGSLCGFCWNKMFRSDIIRKNNIAFDTSVTYWEDGLFTVRYLSCVENGQASVSYKRLYNYEVREGATYGKFNEKELSVFFALSEAEKIAKAQFPKAKDLVLAKRLEYIQREIYRMRRSDGNYKETEKKLKRELASNRGFIIKNRKIMGMSFVGICILMSFSIGLACKAKDIYRSSHSI